MPMIGGDGILKLLCSIKLDVKTDLFKVLEITLHNVSTNKTYFVDVTTNDNYAYERRGNEIILREGPEWSSSDNMYVTMKCEYQNEVIELTGKTVNINYVC